MLERAGDGLYTLNLGNLMAGESATIRYRYAQLLALRARQRAPRGADGDRAALRRPRGSRPRSRTRCRRPTSRSRTRSSSRSTSTATSRRARSPRPRTRSRPSGRRTGVRVTLARGALLDRDFVLDVGGLAGAVAGGGRAATATGYVALASFRADVPRDGERAAARGSSCWSTAPARWRATACEAARGALHRILAALDAGRPVRVLALRQHGRARDRGAGARRTRPRVRKAAERLGAMDADLGGTEMAAALRAGVRAAAAATTPPTCC